MTSTIDPAPVATADAAQRPTAEVGVGQCERRGAGPSTGIGAERDTSAGSPAESGADTSAGPEAEQPRHTGPDRPDSGPVRSGTRRIIRRTRRASAGTDDPTATAPSSTIRDLFRDDSGMSTVEYAIGTVAAAAFAAILYAVVSGDTILGALTGIVQRALTATF